MPCGGQSSFLPHEEKFGSVYVSCVNALWRAVLISTGMQAGRRLVPKKCVNALWRAVLISTVIAFVVAIMTYGGVNALWRAVLISTLSIWAKSSGKMRVNALWRAVLISTR